MIYYEKTDFKEGRAITLEEFKTLFPDWKGELLKFGRVDVVAEFDKLHCCKCPYDEEILFLYRPIVDYTVEGLSSQYENNLMEI